MAHHPHRRDNLPSGAGPGRPPGAKNKPRSPRSIAKRLAHDKMEELLGASIKIVEADLEATVESTNDDGEVVMVPDIDLRRETARFVLQRFGAPSKEKTYIEQELSTALQSYDDLVMISKESILLMIKGDMSFEQVEHLQRIITNHAGIEGYMEVAELRERLAQLEEASNMRTINGSASVPEESQITWGKGATHPPNDTPAE